VRYAFDLDGTLLDTKDAVRQAYVDAGVSPPLDFFGKPFVEWFKGTEEEAKALRKAKAAAYRTRIYEGMVTALPLLSLYRHLAATDRQPIILTGASYESVYLLAEKFRLQVGTILAGCGVKDKASFLNQYDTAGIMFEDNVESSKYLRAATGWTICCNC